MSAQETYLRELRRALPLGYRRRFVAEVREHFASAIEAEHGVDRVEAERLTIERLGPPGALADQMLADLRRGALGPLGRLSAALTVTRLAAAAVLVVAVVVGVAAISVRSSSKTPTVQRKAESPVVRNGVEVRRLVIRLQNRLGKQYWRADSSAPDPVLRIRQQPYSAGVTPVLILRLKQTSP